MTATKVGTQQHAPRGQRPGFSGRLAPLRVVCIGAGASGICFAVKLARRFPAGQVSLQIYEKNKDVGGVWLENRYPGCACDIPSHVYSFGFAPNPDWTHYYSSAEEIHEYFKKVAVDYGVLKHVAFEHKLVSAHWSERGQWDLVLHRADGSELKDACDIFINASGTLNAWKWPDIEGLSQFEGKLVHSANWDQSLKFDDKMTVAVIGNGSSAIQIVPKLQPIVKKLDTFIRTKTWIALPFTNRPAQVRTQAAIAEGRLVVQAPTLYSEEGTNPPYTDAERQHFRDDPAALAAYRHDLESENNARFATSHLRGTPEAKMALEMLTKIMKERLSRKPELADALIPEWSVGCRRLTPGTGYLEALCEPNVEVVTDPIVRIVAEGLETADGTVHAADVIVCATGFDVSHTPKWDLVGRNGYRCTKEWARSPKGYMTIAMAGLPNYFIFNGPNAPLANGSLLPALEAESEYMFQFISKILREDIRSFCVKDEAVEAFCRHVDSWMPRTIWADPCRSWYKNGTTDGRNSGLWPGSVLLFWEAIKHPRFEDFEYTYLAPDDPWGFLGNGLTITDLAKDADKAPYLVGAVFGP